MRGNLFNSPTHRGRRGAFATLRPLHVMCQPQLFLWNNGPLPTVGLTNLRRQQNCSGSVTLCATTMCLSQSTLIYLLHNSHMFQYFPTFSWHVVVVPGCLYLAPDVERVEVFASLSTMWSLVEQIGSQRTLIMTLSCPF
jgi:hypothetical protein